METMETTETMNTMKEAKTMENPKNFWTWPEGYEAVKKLADFLPEEERDAYVMGCFSLIINIC